MDLLLMPEAELAQLCRDVTEESRRRATATTCDDFALIKGQEAAKRAILVAAAGGHSISLIGPSGVGKTMLRAAAVKLGVSISFESRCCPCGNYSVPRRSCGCSVEQIAATVSSLPVADIEIEVPPVPERVMANTQAGTTTERLAEQIELMAHHASLNLGVSGETLLRSAVSELGLDGRARETILRVARTIANLDDSPVIMPIHVAEAINYRAENDHAGFRSRPLRRVPEDREEKRPRRHSRLADLG